MQILEALDYMGPNRRSEQTVLELLICFDPPELEAVSAAAKGLRAEILRMLDGMGLKPQSTDFPRPSPDPDPVMILGGLFCNLALYFQRQAGHVVRQWQVLEGQDAFRYRFIFEREESNTAEKAADVTLLLLSRAVPGLHWDSYTGESDVAPEGLFQRFMELAEPLAMPADSLAIIAAATSRGIPVIKLERDPYSPVAGDFRIRPNSLLMLGQSVHQQIVDGTFCITRSQQALPLLRDPDQRRRFLASLGTPLTTGGQTRDSGHHPSFRALMANHRLLAVLQRTGAGSAGWTLVATAPSAPLQQQLEHISRASGCGMVVIRFQSSEYPALLDGVHGAVSDIDLAPELDRFLPPTAAATSSLPDEASIAFLAWLFPPGSPSRIPTVAVSGTNGKSTTSMMITHIMRAAGLKVGMAYSHGININGQAHETADLSGLVGHYRIFESKEVELGVLETARGGVAMRGFAFDRCTVAVCLNVTDDHLGMHGIHNLNQMALLKRSILERATDAVVINADDAHCRAMVPHLSAVKICLVSMEQDPGALRKHFPDNSRFCVLERIHGAKWIVVHDNSERIPIISVKDIPATFAGRVRFNLSNAMHAICAARLLGATTRHISAAMGKFRMDPDELPGRMNFFEGLPFQVLMDYAHNPDGMEKLTSAVRQFPVSGRRIVMFTAAGDRSDEFFRQIAHALAAHFDTFIVMSSRDPRGRQAHEITGLLRAALLAEGVSTDAVHTVNDELEAVQYSLGLCREDDFLVLLIGQEQMTQLRQLIEDFINKNPRLGTGG